MSSTNRGWCFWRICSLSYCRSREICSNVQISAPRADSREAAGTVEVGPQSPQCLYVCSLFATKLPIRSDVNLTQIQTHSSRRRFDCSACQIWSLFQGVTVVLSYYYLIPSRTRGRGVQGKPGRALRTLLSPAWYSTISFICEVALPSFGPPNQFAIAKESYMRRKVRTECIAACGSAFMFM